MNLGSSLARPGGSSLSRATVGSVRPNIGSVGTHPGTVFNPHTTLGNRTALGGVGQSGLRLNQGGVNTSLRPSTSINGLSSRAGATAGSVHLPGVGRVTPQHVSSFLSMPGHHNVGGLSAGQRTNVTNLSGRTTNINNINSFNRINNTQVTRINHNLNNVSATTSIASDSAAVSASMAIPTLVMASAVRSLTTGPMVFAASGIRTDTMASLGRGSGPPTTSITPGIAPTTTEPAIPIPIGGARQRGAA